MRFYRSFDSLTPTRSCLAFRLVSCVCLLERNELSSKQQQQRQQQSNERTTATTIKRTTTAAIKTATTTTTTTIATIAVKDKEGEAE